MRNLPNGPCGSIFRDYFKCFVNAKDNKFGKPCGGFLQQWVDCVGKHKSIYKPEGENKPKPSDAETKSSGSK